MNLQLRLQQLRTLVIDFMVSKFSYKAHISKGMFGDKLFEKSKKFKKKVLGWLKSMSSKSALLAHHMSHKDLSM